MMRKSWVAGVGVVLIAGITWGALGAKDASVLATEQGRWLDGSWKAQDGFKLSVDAEQARFVDEVLYQVGAEGDTVVPMPTICRYRRSGTLRVVPLEVKKAGDPDLNLEFSVEESTLLPDPENTSACEAFIERENMRAPVEYSVGIRRSGANGFVDTWYELQYWKVDEER